MLRAHAGDAYRQADNSRLLPRLDHDLIARFMASPSQIQAVRGWGGA